MKRIVALVLTPLFLFLTRPAAADEEYSGEILSADAVALGVGLGGELPGVPDRVSDWLWAGAGVLYVGGGPTIHLLHDRGVAALGSAGLRIGAPMAGFAVGVLFTRLSDSKDWSALGYPAAGFILGAAAAIAIDAFWLAREEEGGGEAARMFSIGGRF